MICWYGLKLTDSNVYQQYRIEFWGSRYDIEPIMSANFLCEYYLYGQCYQYWRLILAILALKVLNHGWYISKLANLETVIETTKVNKYWIVGTNGKLLIIDDDVKIVKQTKLNFSAKLKSKSYTYAEAVRKVKYSSP